MSIKVMSWYWEHSDQDGHRLLALLALSDWCTDEGECYPSIKALAQRIRRDERSAQRVVSDLEGDGELVVYPGMGKGAEGRRSPLYYLIKYRESRGLHVEPMIAEVAKHYRQIDKKNGRKGLQVRKAQALLSGDTDVTPTGDTDVTPTGDTDVTPTGDTDVTLIRHIDPSYRSVSIDPSPRVDPPPPILVTSNGGGGGQPNGFHANGIKVILDSNGYHAMTSDSGALRSEKSLSARSLATEWASDFAAGWASLERDMAGWTDAQVRCLLTWLYVWAIETDSQDRSLEPADRYDAGQRYQANYANVYAGSTNRIGLIKSKVAAGLSVPLTEADAVALEECINRSTELNT